MSSPNFFIIGAPKSGTTALSEYLRGHKNIYISTPKEIHYFSTDFPNYRIVDNEVNYLELFSNTTKEHLAIGEASVFYLYSSTAIYNLNEFDKHCKIIVMFRNPIELAYSMHSQLVYSRDESEVDFYKAWHLIELRKIGKNIPENCREPKLLYYDELAKLGGQLKKVLNVIPRERIMIIFFEDFIRDTKGVYKEVLNFLDVPDDNRSNFPRINTNKYHKLPWLGTLTQRPPEKIVNVVLNIKKLLGIEKLGILRRLRGVNLRQVKRKELSEDFKNKLKNCFRDDIATLSELTGRNLDHWLE